MLSRWVLESTFLFGHALAARAPHGRAYQTGVWVGFPPNSLSFDSSPFFFCLLYGPANDSFLVCSNVIDDILYPVSQALGCLAVTSIMQAHHLPVDCYAICERVQESSGWVFIPDNFVKQISDQMRLGRVTARIGCVPWNLHRRKESRG